jgi:hypothetical protein
MPEAAHGKAVPFEFADLQAYKDDASNKDINRLINAPAPVREVRLDQLHAIQHSVNANRVKQYILDPAMQPVGARNPKHRGLVDYPIVVEHKGVLYIHDGHHRLTADLLKGRETAMVRYVAIRGGTH